ncbi:UDP-N-acetylmuramoyl-tripeptide--D-alanyl-D-alanine ligase [Spirulina major CS-329]|uniref:UDP-N-acetylmuramoyl-tripeptide--D-alanyl-D- alanine ligase n=1 Tax=Spirulina TaxID=1154 RepID=UPI00232E0F41|nr:MULTISPECIES: UDP-N-acetylmuramoyl-tripeptide--D-alanyl-D-alanine ligase [Spirulina]MDB9496853.1 UDP-N-acetylmuramoyl-tripeptide--D-alanyl-D-alanine ligase [Spirulina subsalsa CS-330]MDB9503457.1 UDP-N-acetylmuramoyl-tripeptide--D-alanyl-D-alanine ligase [Spirulina major CS-329]
MTVDLVLGQLNAILNTTPTGAGAIAATPITGITTDTRSLEPGNLFVALQGENFDGHTFLGVAQERGAIAAIVQTPVPDLTIPQFPVTNTLTAYQTLGRWWRQQFTIPIIGITGSVGKTTTKELIAAVLGNYGRVHKTQKNYNNEIGVPKTLLQLTPDHDYGVIEMAMRGPGEIAELTEIALPTIGLITNVGTAHIGRLGSEQAIANAKCELLATMPRDSIALLNADNPRLMRTAPQFWQGKTLTYGLLGGDLHGTLINPHTLRVNGQDFPLPLPGQHNASNYLAALAVAQLLGLDWQPLETGVTVDLPGGRSRRIDLPGDVALLDETYNAGYESMVAALQLLKETPGSRHIAVLGTMKELGDAAARLHQQVGQTAEELGIDQLIVLVDDPDAQGIVTGAGAVPCQVCHTHGEIIDQLKTMMRGGDRILFKASNSVGLNQVVAQVQAAY